MSDKATTPPKAKRTLLRSFDPGEEAEINATEEEHNEILAKKSRPCTNEELKKMWKHLRTEEETKISKSRSKFWHKVIKKKSVCICRHRQNY